MEQPGGVVANVKGSSFASRVLWVRLNHGADGIDRLAAQCTPELRALVEQGVKMANWYPFDQFIELNTTIDRVFGKGDGALVRQLGYHGADANLATIYRLFYRVGSVMWLLGRAARLWNAHYDSGRLEVRARGAGGGEAELDIIDFESPSCVHCDAVTGWCQRSIEMSGGQATTVERTQCRRDGAQLCRIRARWS
jgi:hypothetical protein